MLWLPTIHSFSSIISNLAWFVMLPCGLRTSISIFLSSRAVTLFTCPARILSSKRFSSTLIFTPRLLASFRAKKSLSKTLERLFRGCSNRNVEISISCLAFLIKRRYQVSKSFPECIIECPIFKKYIRKDRDFIRKHSYREKVFYKKKVFG